MLFGSGSVVLMAGALRDAKTWKAIKDSYANDVAAATEAARLNSREFARLASLYATEVKRKFARIATAGKKASGLPSSSRDGQAEVVLRSLLEEAYAPIRRALEDIPPSLEKTETAIEHLVTEFLPAHADGAARPCFPELLTVLRGLNPRFVEAHRAQLRRQLLAGDWESYAPRYWEIEWAVAWIRYAERHELRHTVHRIDAECSDIEQTMQEKASTLWENGPIGDRQPNIRGVIHSFWVCSFSHRLRARIEQHAAQALRVALTWQRTDGAWPVAKQGEVAGCAETTAFVVGCLQRYGDGREWDEAVRRGIEWLLANPNPEGGWGKPNFIGATGSLNLVVTVAALDAMRVQGVPLEHPTVETAERALMQQQHPTGGWIDCKGNAEEYLSALVLSYFQRRQQRLARMHEATSLGRGLLLKAQALHSRQYATDQLLALVSLYHGLEYTLYGFLACHQVGIRGKDGKTIGFDAALVAFKDLARQSGWIAANGGLPYGTQLGDMKARRDEVIHRMGQVAPAAVQGFISDAWSFVERFDLPVLGYTLLE
ncbi:hypothetical protein [Burkholderia pseudomallei]|nr:hypothetical protein [Burkholderia pseudomallei]